MYIYLYALLTMMDFLRRWCGGGTYKVIRQLETLYTKIETALHDVDLPKLIANINLIAQHLAEIQAAIPITENNTPIDDNKTTHTADIPLSDQVNQEEKIELNPRLNNESDLPSQLPSIPTIELSPHTNDFIESLFVDKKQYIKDEIREFMLSHYNITALDDKLEGDIYDYMVDTIWHLIFKNNFST